MKRSTKVVIRSITSILVFVVVFLALSVSVVRFFGFEVYGVLTGSMEPEYPTGSLIYVKKIDTSSLQVGDTISFKLSENVIATHRIVELVPDENNPSVMQYRTKGDANDAADSSLVSTEDIIGKVVFCLPKMGYFLNYIQSPTGITTTVLVSLLLIALVFVSELITADGSSRLVWKIRGMITGDRRTPQQARRSQPQRRPSPRYEDDYYDDRRQPSRREAPARRYDDPDRYPSARSRDRYSDDYDRPRRSSRYEDDGYSRSRYDDSRDSRRSSRYDDGYSSRSSRAQSARQPSQRSRYDDDDYYAARRSAASQGRSSARSSDTSRQRSSAASPRSSSYAQGSSVRSSRSSYSDRGSYFGQSSYSGSSRRSRYDDE